METKIKPQDRKKVIYYLNEFYKHYPNEKYTIFHFVRYFKQRLKNNKDAWMGVNGETGGGKSYFVLMAMVLFGRPLDLLDNVSFLPSGNEIINKFKNLNFQTLLIDEAAKEMRGVNWHSKEQQEVNTTAMTDRYKNNWIFLNMPNFNEFTKSMRMSNIQFRSIILYRTKNYVRIVVQRKSRNWRSDDPWYDKKANEIYLKIEKKYKEIDNDKLLITERNMPNYVMDFIIPNIKLILPEWITNYENLKIESRNETIIKKEEKKNKYKNKYEELLSKVSNILYNNELQLGKTKVTKKEIYEKLGVSKDTFNKYLEKK